MTLLLLIALLIVDLILSEDMNSFDAIALVL
eukprot:CAMPEP_0117581424 /NCGR_PEP_ID=MMETSP0784-20121206/65816_1 /TAXON_ID=39447 /ORGANISM="" /LENGTH=30 /DNA_ID= /DNA_START= /DNA_END= /DNA_ORIENTATION=